MTILAVDNDPDRLRELVQNLRAVFPDDTVEYTHDPLMAGKFIFNHSVDMLFTKLNMKRMDGMNLYYFVRQKCPRSKHARVFLIATEQEFKKYNIRDGDKLDGQLHHPVTAFDLHEIALQYHNKVKNKTQTVMLNIF